MISINEEDNYCVSESYENITTVLAVSNDNTTLASDNTTDVLTVSSSDDVLSSVVSVKSSSSSYKTPTKKQRTFNIGGFKAVLTQSQYKQFYKISSIEDEFFDYGYNDYYYIGEKFRGYDITSSGLRKVITVKLKLGKKIKYKKSRVYMIFSYGEGQCGVAYRHMVFLTHYYATYDLSADKVTILGKASKYFNKCKTSPSFAKIKQSKLTSTSYVYRKYGGY